MGGGGKGGGGWSEIEINLANIIIQCLDISQRKRPSQKEEDYVKSSCYPSQRGNILLKIFAIYVTWIPNIQKKKGNNNCSKIHLPKIQIYKRLKKSMNIY